MKIRTARNGDSEAIAKLIRNAYAEYSDLLTPPTAAHTETVSSVRERQKRGDALVAEVDGRICGVVFMHFTDEEVYFDRLAVAPGQRGEGIACQLVRQVENRARVAARYRITLRVRIALPGNIKYFESLGYTRYRVAKHELTNEDTYVFS